MDKKLWVAAILAFIALLGLMGATAALLYVNIPDNNKDLFNVALMAIVGNVGVAFGFFLGGVAAHKTNEAPTPPLPENKP